MKAHELTRSKDYKKFRLVRGTVLWSEAYMHGDRKRVCIVRKEKGGKWIKRYINPHAEVVVVK